MSWLALSVILDDNPENKYVQSYVQVDSIVAYREDPDDENCSYILLDSGHTLHINLALDDLHKMIKGDN